MIFHKGGAGSSEKAAFQRHISDVPPIHMCRIVRAFLIEEQKIVKKVLKLQQRGGQS